MQHTSKPQGYLPHDTLTRNKPSLLLQPQSSRCTKPQVRKQVNAKLDTGRHLRVDSAALEAFLRQYATDEEVTSSDEPDSADFNESGPSTGTAGDGDNEADKVAFTQSLNSRLESPPQVPRASSPTKLARKPDSFDLLALIPHSAIAPYLPQPSITLNLFDIYFLEVPSAKLMFDQKSVVRRYQDSTLPQQVLFAILALASLYVFQK